ncbi:hypothetical protein FPQ18DRAFT_112925 [Pyronema domesticum]|nr:hypothetical protein FPQ18DRAFT_112925 [Pyronema domesticum]
MALPRVLQTVWPTLTARITPHRTTVASRLYSSYTDYKPVAPRPRPSNSDSGDRYNSRSGGSYDRPRSNYQDRDSRPGGYDRPRQSNYGDREARPGSYERPRSSNYEDRPRQSNYGDSESRPRQSNNEDRPRQSNYGDRESRPPRQSNYENRPRQSSYEDRPRYSDRQSGEYAPKQGSYNRPQPSERSFADRYNKPGSYERSQSARAAKQDNQGCAAEANEPQERKDPYEDLKERHDTLLLLIHNTKELFKLLPIEFQRAIVTYIQALKAIRQFENLYRKTMYAIAPQYKPLVDQENKTKLEGINEKIRNLGEGKPDVWRKELEDAVETIKEEHKDFVTLLKTYEKKLYDEVERQREATSRHAKEEGSEVMGNGS